MKTFHTSIHLEMDKPKESVKILIAALHPSIQDSINSYAEKYSLVNVNKYVFFHINEWYMFIYLREFNGKDWVRIDFQIH